MRFSLPFFLLCGALAGWLMSAVVPAGLVEDLEANLHKQPWRVDRPVDDPSEITESRWFFLPMLFGDFDMQMDVELGEGAELDVLLRRVEPRRIGEELLPFAARWTALRLSTEGEGDGWLTRDEALFEDGRRGVGVAPGHTATVWIKARGNMLEANVAGKKLPWFEAEDRYGMFTMLVKGGNAVVHRLEIEPVGVSLWLWSKWTWLAFGVLGAAVFASVIVRLANHWNLIPCGVALPCITWLISRRVEADLGLPDPVGMALLFVGMLLFCCVFATSKRNLARWLILVGCVGAVGSAQPRLTHDNEAVDAAFGEKASSEITEAHGQLVRGPMGLHSIEFDGPRVFLLGGQVLYGLRDLGEHLELLLATQLRARLKKRVDVPCLATADADAGQQWRMYERFYRGFKPGVVVLGFENLAPDEDLRELVLEAKATCEQDGARLVLFAMDVVGKANLDALRRLETEGTPLVVHGMDEGRKEVARRLADVVERELNK